MNFESKYISRLIPYKLSSHRAWELAENGDVLKLDWNEATIPPSPRVIERIIEAIQRRKLNWYPDVDNKILTYKIAEYSKVSVSEVLYFPGSDSIHEYIIKAFIEPEDILLIIGPTYDNFRSSAESGGAKIYFHNRNNKFELDLKILQEKINEILPKVIYLVNPNNPSGDLISISELRELIFNNQDVLFIVDEAYFEFVGQTISGIVGKLTNLIVTRTFSKAFALASFRIGYAISNEQNIKILSKVRNAKNIPLISQVAAEAALESVDYTNNYISEVIQTREKFYDFLINKPFITPFKSYANFIFIKISSNEMKYELLRFLENNNIFIRDYKHVKGMENFIRISIGTSDQMEYVSKLIDNFFMFIDETNNTRP